MTSTSVLRVAHSKVHPWETGDRHLATFTSNRTPKSFKSNQGGLAVDETGETDPTQRDNLVQRHMTLQSSADSGSISPGSKATMALKDNRDPNMVLKRSFSTPAVRSMAQETAQQASNASSEKKRNKLGYHRTSIACTHCRRRKIRCIVSTDVQNRCVNCIRLKKECSFYPVDQQPAPDSRAKTTSQGTTNSGVTSQTPSPALAPGLMAEMPSTAAFQSNPPPLGTAGPTLPSNANAHHISMGRATPNFPSDQPFYIPTQANMPWTSAEPSPVAMPNSAGLGMGWDSFSSEPSVGSEYAAYTHGANAPVPQWVQAGSESTPHQDWNWNTIPPTTRSMSFSGDTMAHAPQQQPMMAMSGGQQYQGVNDMQNLFAAPMSSPLGPPPVPADGSPMGAMPWQQGQPGQSGQQQMVLQHRQQNVYRQQAMGFEGWEFPDSGGGQGQAM